MQSQGGSTTRGEHDRRTSRRQPPTLVRFQSRCRCRCSPCSATSGRRSTACASRRECKCSRRCRRPTGTCCAARRDVTKLEPAAWRGGSVESHVMLGGRQVGLPRLRVRDAEGEVSLASFQWAAATDALEWHTLEAIAAGVSTPFARTLDPVPAEVSERATSRRPCRGGSWRCRPNGCGRLSAVRWATCTCVWSASTVRGSRNTAT